MTPVSCSLTRPTMHRTLAALLISGAMAAAEEPLDPRITPEALAAFAPAVFDDEGFKLPYRLSSPPADDGSEKRPLLVFLHGFGERGDDNQRQLIHGGGLFASEEFRNRHRAYVLVPQCPAGNQAESDDPVIWGLFLRPTDGSVPLGIDLAPAPPMRAVTRLVDQLIATLPIDANRVYVGGLSMGGYATWELVARRPDFWAASLPICGGGNPAWGPRLAGTPCWAFHGDADDAVPVDRSREMVAAVNGAGGRVVYTEYPGVNHDSWTPTFASRFAWDWLFAQRR